MAALRRLRKRFNRAEGDGMQVMDRPLQQILEAAFASHQAGQLEEAERLYRKLLRRSPLNPDGLHLLGLLRHQRGQSSDAEDLIAKAIRLRPDVSAFYENLAAIQRARGAVAAAIETCRAGLGQAPSPRLASALLEALLDSGAFAEALTLLDDLDRSGPVSADRLADRALCLLRLGRPAEAVEAAERSLAIDLANGNATSVLAEIATLRGDHAGAADLWRQALRDRPDWVAARINLGNSLLRQGDAHAAAETLSSMPLPPDPGLAMALLNGRAAAHRRLGENAVARRCLEAALTLVPAAECLSNLSELRRRDDPAAALRLAERALAAHPFHAGAMTNRGLAQEELDREQDAVASGRRAIALQPGDAEILNNLCSPLRSLSRFAEAAATHRRAIAARPDFAYARYSLGTLQLQQGDLESGWRNYEWRLRGGDEFSARPFRQRPWQGEVPEETLLVWGEQGLGDEIIFGSMLPELALRGIRAIVECDRRMTDIFARSVPEIAFIARADPPDPRLTADDVTAQVAMGALARHFRARVSDFPVSGGYLKPRADLVDRWRQRLAELSRRPKVGFAWRSSRTDAVARRDHPPVLDWAPVLQQKSVDFVSLQYGAAEPDLRKVEATLGVRVHTFPDLDLMNDLEGVLALAAALDLTISSPTTSFCLPAAVGAPVWLLVPEGTFWLLGTDRFPWFSNIHAYIHNPILTRAMATKRIAEDLAIWASDGRDLAP